LLLSQNYKSLSLGTAAVRHISDMNETFGFFNVTVAMRGMPRANDARYLEVPTEDETVRRNIPLSSIMQFQRKSQKAVRGSGFAEFAVWTVFAASSVTTILLSLSQISPPSVQPSLAQDSSVVCDQQKTQPVYAFQTI
jgi:hypothetical protein